jgi:hypothetical protein
MRQVLYQGQVVWIDDEGHILGIAGGGFPGAEPGISNAREADIMSRLPDADIVGLIGPGVVPGGERAVGARRAEAEHTDLIRPRPVPTYRPLAGAQQNNRGNTKIVELDVVNGFTTPVFVASVIETPKANGDDAEVISVQLGLSLPPEMTANPGGGGFNDIPINVLALIEWGIGGAINTAIADWNQGTSFSVNASYVRVSAQFQPPVPGGLARNVLITLTGTLGYGNAMSLNVSSPLRRTVDVVTPGANVLAAGATSAFIPVPLWAAGFTLVDSSPTNPDYTITLSDGVTVSAIFRLLDRSNQSMQVEGQFPLPDGSRYVRVTNNLGVDVIRPKLLFNLAL